MGEDLQTLGAEIERLSRLAYPECTHEIRDKIACAQFVAALTDGFLKRTIQLENINSLKSAIERAMAIRVIQGNSFPRRENRFGDSFPRKENRFGDNFPRRDNRFYPNHKFFNKNSPEHKVNFGNKEKTFDKGNTSFQGNNGKFSGGVNKECWECGKTGHFRAECPALNQNQEVN